MRLFPLSILSLAAAFLLDLLLGDPRWMYHPVRLIGLCIQGLERVLRRLFPATASGEFAGGVVLAVAVPLLSALLPAMLLIVAARIHIYAWFALETLFCYQLLAARSMCDESLNVYFRLREDDLPGACEAVSRIVGRDTGSLSTEQVAAAAVESVAESTNDGVIAPLFYMALGGAALGFFYKAVNTLDSMVGYRNELYRHFGTASAKLDDAVGYLPARLAARLMIAAAWLGGFDSKTARRVYLRDRGNHASPNSAHTEAVCAGALQIQLGGNASYFGEIHHKPTIGDDTRPLSPEDIPRANRLLLLTTALCLCVACVAKAIIVVVILQA